MTGTAVALSGLPAETGAASNPSGTKKPQLSPRTAYWLLALWGLGVVVVYTMAGADRYVQYESYSFDLGVYTQAVSSLAHFHLATVPLDLKSWHSFFGDHFSPVLVLVVPFFWAYQSPVTLIAVQGLVIALSMVPVYKFAQRRWGAGPALAMAMAYSMSWGVQSLALFDFHPDVFAMLLIALAVERADAGAWGSSVASTLALLAVKEDLALVVLVMGVLYALYWHHRRLGAVVSTIGAAALVVITQVVVPAFATGSANYVYFAKFYSDLGKSMPSAAASVLTNPLHAVKLLFSPVEKVRTLYSLLVAWWFLPLFSPLFLLAVPLLLERFWSVDHLQWVRSYQYNGPVMPILALGYIDTVERVRRALRAWDVRRRARQALHQEPGAGLATATGAPALWQALPAVAAALAVFASLFMAPQRWVPLRLVQAAETSNLAPNPIAYTCDKVVSRVPMGVSVEASDPVAPHLVVGRTVWLPGQDPSPPQYLVVASYYGSGTQSRKAMSYWKAEVGAIEPGLALVPWLSWARAHGYREIYSYGYCQLWKAP